MLSSQITEEQYLVAQPVGSWPPSIATVAKWCELSNVMRLAQLGLFPSFSAPSTGKMLHLVSFRRSQQAGNQLLVVNGII